MADSSLDIWNEWENREGPCVFATVDGAGNPNAIYVTCIRRYDDNTILIADNYFHKTRENLKHGSRGSVLFITGDRKAYQIKGKVSYLESGELRDYMKDCLDPKYPVVAVAALTVEDIYSGAEKIR